MFIFNDEKFLWIDPVFLGKGTIEGMLEDGDRYYEILPISSKKFREINPTTAKILINEETGTIDILDDSGRPYYILLDGVSDKWIEILREVAKGNNLCK